MNMTLKMAYLNMWRRKSRSLAVMLMVAVSVTGLLLMQGIYDGMIEQMVDNSIRSDSGQISLYGKGHRLSRSLHESIREFDAIENLLAAAPEVKSFITRIRHEGLAATARHSQGALFVGTRLADESRHANLAFYLTEGSYDFGKRGALIGSELAKKLKLTVGKKLIITAQNSQNELASLALRVSGIIRTGDVAMDKTAVLLDYDRLEAMLALDGRATQISITLHDKEQVDAFAEALQTKLADKNVEVFSWKQLFPLWEQMDEIMAAFNAISYGLVFVVASIGIFGVILVSVLERVREFGIMLAIGAPFASIRRLIILESMLLGLFGLAAGMLAGGGGLLYLSRYGIDLSAWSQGLAQWGINTTMYATIDGRYFFMAALSVVLATFFAALWPIRILKKLHPIEAINA
jgi:ABC-type lipoprotein release transport system permease subunit